MAADLSLRHIAIIGFGEAGSILGEDLARTGRDIVTYDILLDAAESREAMLEKARKVHVRAVDTLQAAIEGADLVISAVTAASAADVAAGAARTLRKGQLFLDINSVSPATKKSNARVVEATGADYVEAAVMAPVPPQRLAVPMLLGGSRASELATVLREVGMNTTAIASEIGVASAVKMCRSIMIKGIEALTVECVLAARRFGAENEVLASLERTFPGMGWTGELPDYLVSRVAEHGRRRAAEMREVARTIEEVGVDPMMATATAQRQEALVNAMAAIGLTYDKNEPFSWRDFADKLARGAGAASLAGKQS